jgi:hypothetical protein
MKQVYVLVEDIDLGVGILGVFSSLDKIPFELVPSREYHWQNGHLAPGKVIEGSWEVVGQDHKHVYVYDVE